MTFILGLIIGAVLGLTGAGGSVFAVPLLMALLTLTAQQAIGLSLGAVSLCALYGVLIRLKSGHIQWLPAIVFATIGSLFSPLGNWSNQFVPTTWLLLGFASLVIVVAVRMWTQASRQPEKTKVVRANAPKTEESGGAICKVNHGKPFAIGPRCVMGMAMTAALTGFLSGLFGVGGGFLIVPALLFLTGISMAQAVATSLVIIALVSGSGFISFLLMGNPIDTHLLWQVALGGLAGMTLGIGLGQKIAGAALQKTFALLMFVMATVVVSQAIT